MHNQQKIVYQQNKSMLNYLNKYHFPFQFSDKMSLLNMLPLIWKGVTAQNLMIKVANITKVFTSAIY